MYIPHKMLRNCSVTQLAWVMGKNLGLLKSRVSISNKEGVLPMTTPVVDNAVAQAAVFIHQELRRLCT